MATGDGNDCIQAMQRAYKAQLEAGSTYRAVRCAFWIAMILLTGGEPAVAGGWVARANRLLDAHPDDVVERGYLLMPVMFRHIFGGEFDQALTLAEEVTDYGRRFDEPDLLTTGLNAQGRMLLYTGRVPEGLALLDEAMIGLSTGEVSPLVAGETYCSLIEACQEISDFGRAAEWTSALTRWIEVQPDLVLFTGQCSVHRGQLMRLQGDLGGALEEFRLSADRYRRADTPAPAGLAMDEYGRTLQITGDLVSAEAAFAQATDLGHDPQPNVTLLWLAQGKLDQAAASIRRLLDEPRDPVHRSQVLPAAVEVLLAVGDLDGADTLSQELCDIATSFGCLGLVALARHARGSFLLASGEPSPAAAELSEARNAWQRLGAQYEVARTRLLLAKVLRALGDDQSAESEESAATRALDRMGAAPTGDSAPTTRGPAPSGLTAREVEVLRLVATGKSNAEIATTLTLSEKTVARHLSNIFTKLDVTSRTAAAAFAFQNRLL